MSLTSSGEEQLLVTEEEATMRLDLFLKYRFPHYSRNYFHALLGQQLVLVNGVRIKKGARLQAGDEVEVEFACTPEISLTAEEIPLEIVYEDNYLLAVNKPAGMVVHPAVGHWQGTFVNALLYHCQRQGVHLSGQSPSVRPGIVHRLDRETSGLLLAAKEERTQRLLVEAFAERQIDKQYLAICVGTPGECRIQTQIGRHPMHRKEMAVVTEGGRAAETHCSTLTSQAACSLVQLIPKTGRTHQLRVHMRHLATPIVGDPIYGYASFNKKYGIARQLLHAHRLQFIHPITGKMLQLEAAPPADFLAFMEKMALESNRL